MHDFPVCLFNPACRGCQNPINGLCVPAGASESSLDLVGDEEDVVSGADLSYSGQVSVVGHNHSRLALYRLHHERTDATIASRLLTTNRQLLANIVVSARPTIPVPVPHRAEGAQLAPQIVAIPHSKFSRTLAPLWSIDSKKN